MAPQTLDGPLMRCDECGLYFVGNRTAGLAFGREARAEVPREPVGHIHGPAQRCCGDPLESELRDPEASESRRHKSVVSARGQRLWSRRAREQAERFQRLRLELRGSLADR